MGKSSERKKATKIIGDELDGANETDVTMEILNDGKKVILIFESKDVFTVSSFQLDLETYLHEYSRAVAEASAAYEAGDPH